MSEPGTEAGAEQQGGEAPNETAAAAPSATDAPVKEEPTAPERSPPAVKASATETVGTDGAPAERAEVVDGVRPDPDGAGEVEGAQPAPEEGVGVSPAEGAEQTQPAPEGTDAAQTAAGGPEGAQTPPGGPEGAQTAAGGPDGDQAPSEAEDKVPELVKVVHSARSVFRQRDVKEYDPFTAHLERRITKLFEALDTEQTGRVDVHELGTLIRSVGCCPSETELQEMVTQLEEEGQPGFIRLETVMPYIIQCVEDRKYPSASTEQLLQAFQVLADDCAAQQEARAGSSNKEKKEEDQDTLPQDKLVHILTEEGEHFSQEEVEEMLSVVPASDTARVDYKEFVKQLVVPELW